MQKHSHFNDFNWFEWMAFALVLNEGNKWKIWLHWLLLFRLLYAHRGTPFFLLWKRQHKEAVEEKKKKTPNLKWQIRQKG